MTGHPWKRKVIFQTIIFRFHVNLRGCNDTNKSLSVWKKKVMNRNKWFDEVVWLSIDPSTSGVGLRTAESWKGFLTPGTKSDTIHCVNLLCIVFTVHCHHCESWVLLSGGKYLSGINVESVSESRRIQVQTAKLKTHCIAVHLVLTASILL